MSFTLSNIATDKTYERHDFLRQDIEKTPVMPHTTRNSPKTHVTNMQTWSVEDLIDREVKLVKELDDLYALKDGDVLEGGSLINIYEDVLPRIQRVTRMMEVVVRELAIKLEGTLNGHDAFIFSEMRHHRSAAEERFKILKKTKLPRDSGPRVGPPIVGVYSRYGDKKSPKPAKGSKNTTAIVKSTSMTPKTSSKPRARANNAPFTPLVPEWKKPNGIPEAPVKGLARGEQQATMRTMVTLKGVGRLQVGTPLEIVADGMKGAATLVGSEINDITVDSSIDVKFAGSDEIIKISEREFYCKDTPLLIKALTR